MVNHHLLSLIFLLLLLVSATPSSSVDSAAAAAAIISRFQTYLRIDTAHPSPDYPAAVSFLQSLVKPPLQFQVLEFVSSKPLLLVTWPGSSPSLPSLLLNSHTDVVPSEPSKWSPLHPPFGATMDDSSSRIFARGSQDMKCVSLQYLEAAARLAGTGFVPTRTVHFSFVPDEEIGGEDGAKAFAESEIFKELNVGLVLDEGLANPGEEYRVFYAERSPWWGRIRAVGAPGHGAKLYDGGAMENLVKGLEGVMRFRRSQFDLVKSGEREEGEVVSVNLVYLKAGTPSEPSPTGFVMNLQPSEAEAGLDIRVPPNADPVALERRIAEEWAPSCRNLTFEYKQKAPLHDKFGNPLLTVPDSSNPWWVLLEKSIKEAGGKLKKPEIFPASTDARYFRDLGIPAFGFSPMANTPILLHDHNEFLHKDEYLKGIEIYESIIKTLSSYKGEEHAKDPETRAEL